MSQVHINVSLHIYIGDVHIFMWYYICQPVPFTNLSKSNDHKIIKIDGYCDFNFFKIIFKSVDLI